MHKLSTVYTIFFAAVLIFSMYSIPNNIQVAFAHEDSTHALCWNLVFNSATYIFSLIEFIWLLILLFQATAAFAALLFPVAFAALAQMVVVKNQMLVLKATSPAYTIPATWLCAPELIPPPVTSAGSANLDCNTDLGFEFNRIENDLSNWGGVKGDPFQGDPQGGCWRIITVGEGAPHAINQAPL